jgi:hypothetical protein
MQRAALAWIACAVVALACGDDEASAPAPKPPPTLAIASVSSAGGPTWTPGSATCVEVGSDPAGTLVVGLQIEHFSLRAPGACAGLRPCGTAVLLLDGSSVAESATTAISLRLLESDASIEPGPREFRVELRDHTGAQVLDQELNPVSDEVTLDVRLPGGCTGLPDAGPDAPADAGDGGDAPDGGDAANDASPDAFDAETDASGPDAAEAGDAAEE